MPRRKLSEFRSKIIVNDTLGLPYIGWESGTDLSELDNDKSYVVKVDQAVKGRFKKGLVLLDIPKKDITSAVEKLGSFGYTSVLIEPYITHDNTQERYLSITITRQGYLLSYSQKGGVDIEKNHSSVRSVLLDSYVDWNDLAKKTDLSVQNLQSIYTCIKRNHFSFLEINPYIVESEKVVILDCAIEIDDAGSYAVHEWNENDLRNPRVEKNTPEEDAVRFLDKNSPASFNLSVLNPNGSIFLLLSGGGASVVIADEVYNVGKGKELANYGEYSGNPTADEAYVYTQQVLSLIGNSSAPQKVLFIGGAAANFTDIANTFNGVIRAVEQYADILRENHVKIYVRRGGPRQEIGLEKIKNVLEKEGLLGSVDDPSVSITDALNKALKELDK